LIKYIGSKRTLVPLIVEAVRRVGNAESVIDLFSGTSRVGHALKAAGYRVLSNDHNAYAATLARCYVQADEEDTAEDARKLVQELNRLPGTAGYFTETFCVKSRFFQPKNGERIDAIREAIAAKGLEPELEAVLLVALMEAADRVDSTTGLQMAYLKSWAPRAHNDLELRVPAILRRARHGKGSATCLDAFEATGVLEGDIAYVDPPYNQHSYLGNYHIWESLVRWDKPEVYGVACKRIDVRERQSIFNSRPRFEGALGRLLGSVRARVLIVSFNNEGYLTREQIESMLAALWDGEGKVTTIERDFKRYVGAQIGIHNLRGEKVGTVSHLRNKEFVYVVSRAALSSQLAPIANEVRSQLSLFESQTS
jgi:adenine-specific DNA-methyltransferase